MIEGLKKSRVSEAIKHGIDVFLGENADVLGYSHVEHIIMSNDLRSCVAVIIASNEKNVVEIMDFCKTNHYHIGKELKKIFSSKYLPKISFEVISDEKVGF